MHFSRFGRKFQTSSGILQLMDDLGNALASDERMLMLGGGNPSHIPKVQALYRRRMKRILKHKGAFERMIGNYQSPQGEKEFVQALAALLRSQFGWEVGPENIVLTNGSQTAFFILFNLFAGLDDRGVNKKILFPLAPEYIGYSDIGLEKNFASAIRPQIEFLDQNFFKYHIDFKALSITEEIGAICVSRPTNPTGNVLTDSEIERLVSLAKKHELPLIIDSAYGTPFPNIIYTEANPVFNQHTVVCMSLSKLGLPATRTGVVIANEELIRIISSANAVLSLSPSSVGAALALDLIKSGEIIKIGADLIRPFYRKKAGRAVRQLQKELRGVDFLIHKPEGAFFLWLWFRNLPVTSQMLYQRLKQRGVLVVSGHYFFPGLTEPWPHQHECIRVTYAQDERIVKAGLSIIAEEVKKAFHA
ncbi:MAG: valine--pyruvate transaminase [Deltaproteobacteria bacterium]|nr:valine--pyruvate transaminase [Deltaproteobacteria bacterium]